MNLLEMLRVTMSSLSAHKLRFALSVLGIMIGVASVIAMISVSQGATYDVRARVESLGSDMITISAAFRLGRAGTISSQAAGIFTLDLATELVKAPAVQNVVPISQVSGSIKYQDLNLQTSLVGVTPAYGEVVNYQVAFGRFFSEQDLNNYAKVLVLGSEVAEQIFLGENPLSKEVVVERGGVRLLFTVIGVMTSKGQMGFARYDDQVYLPITTLARRITGQRSVNSYSVQAVSTQLVDEAIQQLEFILSRKLNNPEDYRVRSQQEIIETVNQTAVTLTFLLGGVAGIALIVGGIGIMNILLVSVIERTREIGIRKALGAKRRDILFQFLTESTFISVVGGIIGLLFGVGISAVIAHFSRWPLIVPSISIALALGFSLTVGLLFGVYPAAKASRLDPVEALRYE
jgi:putative ABC transport system permease protein